MGDPTVDFAINLLGNVLGELLAHLIESAGRVLGRRPARGAEGGQARQVADGLVRELDRLRGDELAQVSMADWREAVELLRDCLDAAAPFDMQVALEAALRPEGLEAIVRDRSARLWRGVPLSDDATVAFDLLLAASCGQILNALMATPGFDDLVRQATYAHSRSAHEAVEELAARDARIAAEAARAYEKRYLAYLGESLSQFELFGVIRGRAPRQQSFDDAYVSLAVARTGGADQTADADEELTGAGIDVANAFADRRRVILRGNAGTGKTTLLQWLAANAAARRLAGGPRLWGEVVPFLVHLRDFTNQPLPQVEELPAAVARPIEGERPAGWVVSRFRDGAALLLVDGVDEVAVEYRGAVRDWLAGIVRAYPRARYIVTARPFAVPEDWLTASGFEAFDLLPLSAEGIRDFLRRWHAAARREHAHSADVLRWLEECEKSLAELMRTRQDLRRLAAARCCAACSARCTRTAIWTCRATARACSTPLWTCCWCAGTKSGACGSTTAHR